MLELLTGMELYDSEVDTVKLSKLFGIKQTTVEEAVRSYSSQQKMAQSIRAT